MAVYILGPSRLPCLDFLGAAMLLLAPTPRRGCEIDAQAIHMGLRSHRILLVRLFDYSNASRIGLGWGGLCLA